MGVRDYRMSRRIHPPSREEGMFRPRGGGCQFGHGPTKTGVSWVESAYLLLYGGKESRTPVSEGLLNKFRDDAVFSSSESILHS
jgi:hypothetical protein